VLTDLATLTAAAGALRSHLTAGPAKEEDPGGDGMQMISVDISRDLVEQSVELQAACRAGRAKVAAWLADSSVQADAELCTECGRVGDLLEEAMRLATPASLSMAGGGGLVERQGDSLASAMAPSIDQRL